MFTPPPPHTRVYTWQLEEWGYGTFNGFVARRDILEDPDVSEFFASYLTLLATVFEDYYNDKFGWHQPSNPYNKVITAQAGGNSAGVLSALENNVYKTVAQVYEGRGDVVRAGVLANVFWCDVQKYLAVVQPDAWWESVVDFSYIKPLATTGLPQTLPQVSCGGEQMSTLLMRRSSRAALSKTPWVGGSPTATPLFTHDFVAHTCAWPS